MQKFSIYLNKTFKIIFQLNSKIIKIKLMLEKIYNGATLCISYFNDSAVVF